MSAARTTNPKTSDFTKVVTTTERKGGRGESPEPLSGVVNQPRPANVARPTPGRCRFCGITEDQIDGDRHRWLGDSRTVCAKPACIRAHYAEADRRKFEDRQRKRKRTPAEIHELIRGRKPRVVGPKQQRLKKTRGAA
jgi:hypothetical protein